ncbi:MAG TPA: thioredoxin [Flavisolibacter sp.]|nr:thioredoxin [Flavisolibacter sp.]
METGKQTFGELIKGEKPVLVDFFAEWCGPCKLMPPILHQVKQQFGDDVTILKVDVDKNNSLAFQFGIQGVPTLIVFQKGEVRWRQSGVIPAGQLQAVLRQYIS